MDKRGQFFILAAMIISVTIVGLVTVRNYVIVNQQPAKFYALSYEIKDESAEVINYGVASGKDVSELLLNYTSRVKKNIYDQDPNANFIFIYGNESGFTIENLGEDAFVNGQHIVGCGDVSNSSIQLSLGGNAVNTSVSEKVGVYNPESCRKKFAWSGSGSKEIVTTINNKNYTFSLEKGEQFIVIMKKNTGNETYVPAIDAKK